MIFRTAAAADADAIANLHAQSWRIVYRGVLADAYLDGDILRERQAQWHERFQHPAPNQYIVVAEDNGRIAGFACAYGNADDRCGTLLENLHVDPDRKGQGIGAMLMADVARWSVACHPGSGMHLFVVEKNHAARRFYERLGGVVNGEEMWAAPDGSSVKALRYAWQRFPPAWLAARG
ncbi:MAG TPA: GNAT family N-acetyltransferase [Paucimonas sp.]|nr:GNAT family N-acetyltransferase [Paucimonas sp.]